MAEQVEIPDSLIELVNAAMERAFGWLQSDDSFLAFAVVESPTILGMPVGEDAAARRRFVAPLVLAPDSGPLREYVAEQRNEIAAYALVIDGVITDPDSGERSTAVCVEAGESGGAAGFVFVEIYGKSKPDAPPDRPGRRFVTDIVENLLTVAPVQPAPGRSRRGKATSGEQASSRTKRGRRGPETSKSGRREPARPKKRASAATKRGRRPRG